jgi:Na+/melibiose symporter-like transporter
MSVIKIASYALAALLFLCLADMPYGYYQFVRLAAAIFFVVAAMDEIQTNRNQIGIVFIGLAILFQPLVKIALGRELWNILDVIVGIGLIGYGAMKDK